MKTTKKKTFDAVIESRRWKESVARQTAGMSRTELLVFFNDAPTAAPRPCDAEETSVLRAEPPKP